MRSRDIDRLMRKFGKDDGLYRIADKYDNRYTWQEGHCWTFARMLQVFFGRGELYALAFRSHTFNIPDHVYLMMDDLYHDSRGRHTLEHALEDHADFLVGREIPEMFMIPLSLCSLKAINPCLPETAIDRLVARMRRIA